MATGFIWHERYLWHNTGRQTGPFGSDASGWLEPDVRHRENADGKRRIRSLLEVTGLLDQLVRVDPRPATVEEVCRVHVPEYVERIREASAAFGGDGGDGATPFGTGSFEVALLSAGGVMAAVDAVLDGTVANAFALVRPPGHHALPDTGMGFCLFGNAAIAARHALAARGLDRVAIVDWDVHHGNGTQVAFYDDPAVLTISLHQDSNFPPGSGTIEENGEGAGAGYNLNVPLPPGCGTGAYAHAFETVVVPALDAFGPDLIIVASGLDASAMDPLGRMMMTPRGYGELTQVMLDAADRLCGGRLVVEHEGGYSEELVPFCALAIVERLSGIQTECRDTILPAVPRGWPSRSSSPTRRRRSRGPPRWWSGSGDADGLGATQWCGRYSCSSHSVTCSQNRRHSCA
jgi:acetoin utilization deacetylase AcuC-like enzyme